MALLSTFSSANEPVEAAEYAVRSLVRSKVGSQYRVVFETHSERILSLTEEVVSGRGHVYDGNDWNFDRTFDYSVKVKYDGSSTRDVSVTFTNGERQVDQGDWKKSNHKQTAVHLSTPRWFEKVNTNAVVFEGSANGNVSIEVFDRNNRKVASDAVNPRSGLFRITLNLPNGQYRAVLSPGGWEIADEVRFSVDAEGRNRPADQDWGTPNPYLKVSEPAKGARLSNTRVTFSGNSSERAVYLQVWDARNNRVLDRDIPVRDRYWNSQAVLPEGGYRFTVTSGKSVETRTFLVEGPGKKPKPGDQMVRVRVQDPKRDGVVNGPRVTVAGDTLDGAVLVQVWDSRNNMVVERRVPAVNGYFNTSIPMNAGRYKVKVTGHSGNDFEEFFFTVR